MRRWQLGRDWRCRPRWAGQRCQSQSGMLSNDMTYLVMLRDVSRGMRCFSHADSARASCGGILPHIGSTWSLNVVIHCAVFQAALATYVKNLTFRLSFVPLPVPSCLLCLLPLCLVRCCCSPPSSHVPFLPIYIPSGLRGTRARREGPPALSKICSFSKEQRWCSLHSNHKKS